MTLVLDSYKCQNKYSEVSGNHVKSGYSEYATGPTVPTGLLRWSPNGPMCFYGCGKYVGTASKDGAFGRYKVSLIQ